MRPAMSGSLVFLALACGTTTTGVTPDQVAVAFSYSEWVDANQGFRSVIRITNNGHGTVGLGCGSVRVEKWYGTSWGYAAGGGCVGVENAQRINPGETRTYSFTRPFAGPNGDAFRGSVSYGTEGAMSALEAHSDPVEVPAP